MRITKLMLLGDRKTQIENLRARGWRFVQFQNVALEVGFHRYQKDGAERVEAKAWRGNADVPAWYYSFKNEASARAYVNDYAARLHGVAKYRANAKAERAAKRAALKASDHYTVGDVLYNSWGYDQTNIDWYEVVELKPKSIGIRPIAGNYAETGYLSGHTQPQRGHYTGDKIMKPLAADGSIAARHGCFAKWDGKAKYESHYA